MKFQGITGNFTEASAEALAVAVFKGEKSTSGVLKELDRVAGGLVTAVIKNEEFNGEIGQTALLRFASNGKIKASRLMLIGVGEKADYKGHSVANVAGGATRYLRKRGIKSFALLPRSEADPADTARHAVIGFITSQFELDKYKTKDKNGKSVTNLVICINGANAGELKKAIASGEAIGESINFTRDLANEPPNILHPTEMARRAERMAKEVGLKCEILDETKMRRLGMGSLMSVALGSAQAAKLIVLKYTPTRNTGPNGELLALVGKGITFDTGGISIKPAENMDAMKYDMSGGATVLGTMRAIALLKPSVPVLGVVAAVENMPDGGASRPSDVVTAMTGKTVEILNTDAEGRLVLADAVAYAEREGATRIIDMATLTGAVIIALGDQNTGIMGNDQALVDEIISTGK
ncbi:MAG TPA: leucyl aminopeptidase, partial [Pyrinomonadaceae bacterium]|nr:leucyl aminopeptidase [Pyrinomonadaceae bacterium]